jgi:hypothetical protein
MMFEATASNPEINLMETIQVKTNMNHSPPLDNVHMQFVVSDEHTAKVLEKFFSEALPVRTDTHDLIRFRWLNRPQIMRYKMCNVPCSMDPRKLATFLQEKYQIQILQIDRMAYSQQGGLPQAGNFLLTVHSKHPLPDAMELAVDFAHPPVIYFYPIKPSRPVIDLRSQEKIEQEQKERLSKLQTQGSQDHSTQTREVEPTKPKEMLPKQEHLPEAQNTETYSEEEHGSITAMQSETFEEQTESQVSPLHRIPEKQLKQRTNQKLRNNRHPERAPEMEHNQQTMKEKKSSQESLGLQPVPSDNSQLHPFVTVRPGAYPSPPFNRRSQSTANPLFECEEGVTSSQETILVMTQSVKSDQRSMLEHIPKIQDWATPDHCQSAETDEVTIGSPTDPQGLPIDTKSE